jgi:hypothetical protein
MLMPVYLPEIGAAYTRQRGHTPRPRFPCLLLATLRALTVVSLEVVSLEPTPVLLGQSGHARINYREGLEIPSAD